MHATAQYFQNALKDFLTSPQFSNLDFETSLPVFCEVIATTVAVKRVGIWGLDLARTRMTQYAQYQAEALPQSAHMTLGVDDAQGFLREIAEGRVVNCPDVTTAPVCAALMRRYLPGHAVTSLLAMPLYCSGRVSGVLMLEHVGPARVWTEAEVDFVTSFSGIAAQAFAMKDHAPPAPDSMALERRTRFYAEHVSDWYWETDATYTVVSVASGNTRVGDQLQSLVGDKLWGIPDYMPVSGSWDDFRVRVEALHPIDGMLFTSPPKDGKHRYGEVMARPIYDADGDFIGYWGITRDVTSRVARDFELQASEQKYLNAARMAHVASWVWDETKARITYGSRELGQIYGVSESELVRRTIARKLDIPRDGLRYEKDLSWVHPDDREAYRAVNEAASRNQTGYDTVFRIVRDDGSVRTIHERCEPVFDLSGHFIETTGVLMDITAQEDRKRALAHSRAQIANLMDNIPGAIYRVKNDAHWTRIYISAGFNALCCPETALTDDAHRPDLNLRDLIAAPDLQRIRDAVDAAVRTDTVYEIDYPVTRSDGSTIWLSDRGRPIVGDNGDVELEGILIDITKKHEAEASLLKAQRLEAIGQLTGGIAHDFNNLLAVILGNLELLRDELDNPEHIEFVEAGIGATWRGAELTKNMLSFARRASLQPTALDLNSIVTDTQKWVSRTLPENIVVQVKTAPDLWDVKADRSSTESALLNLIVNARDAMPKGGHLVISTANVQVDAASHQHIAESLEVGRYVVLTVSDTGHGMTKAEMTHIFEPFYTTKSAGSGSGLGLSMIQGFMKQSGGAVLVRSQPDIGTMFEIYFAATRPKHIGAPVEVDPIPPQSLFHGAKVLVAEDETLVLDVVTKTLAHLGCAVTPARNGDEALRIFRQSPDFDFLVTDIVMPGTLMGPHLADALREIRPDLPVIFMSGYADEAMIHGKGLRQGDVRLNKPASRSSLIAAVKKVLSPS